MNGTCKIIYLIISLTLLLISCKKDKDSVNGDIENNFLKVTIDGEVKNFQNVSAYWVEGGNYLSINAIENSKESLNITVMSESTRVPSGSYSLEDNSGFTLLSTHTIFKAGNQIHHTATRNTVAEEDALQLKIDKINNTTVEGSFSGTLIRVQGLNTLGKIILTNGRFKTTIKPN